MNGIATAPGAALSDPPDTQPQFTPPPSDSPPVAVAAPADDPPSHVYFKKFNTGLPFYVERQRVAFEPLDRNFGVLKISPLDPIVPGLMAAATAKRGGVSLISEAQYEELKKKLPLRSLAPKLPPPRLRVAPTGPPKSLKPGGPLVSPARGNAVAADSVFVRNRTNRVSDGIGVGPVGGGGAGEGAGTPMPVPASVPPPAGEFRPAVGKKYKTPVTRKSARAVA